MIYLELFWSFFKIGLLSIGGGYAAMPIIQNQVIDIHHWLTMTQFTDIITIAEMTPGQLTLLHLWEFRSLDFVVLLLQLLAVYFHPASL